MKIEQYTPATILRPFIKTFMIIESKNGMENRLLPDTSIVMAFRYRGRISSLEGNREDRLPASLITGLRNSTRIVAYAKETATVLVIFREGGAVAFFEEPLHTLFGMSIPVDSLFGPQKSREVEEQLAEAGNNRDRIAIIERFLLSELRPAQTDTLVLHAIEKIKSVRGNIKIKDLLADLPVSRDPFEKRFRRATGTSPKQFSTIIRLRNLIDTYSNVQSLTEATYIAGYFDQAHFIKDFKSFTGQTPHIFFKSSSFW